MRREGVKQRWTSLAFGVQLENADCGAVKDQIKYYTVPTFVVLVLKDEEVSFVVSVDDRRCRVQNSTPSLSDECKS